MRKIEKKRNHSNKRQQEQAFCERTFQRVLELRRRGNPDYAYRLLDRILHYFPLAARLHYAMGLCALSMGACSNAIQGFAAASALMPKFEDAELGLAETLAFAGDEERAISIVQNILKAKPKYIKARLAYGKILELRGEWKQALEQYLEVEDQETDLEYPELLNRIAMCYMNLEEPIRALDRLNEAIRLRPDNVEFLYNRGHCHGMLGNFSEAAADFEAVVGINKRDAEALAFSALYLYYQGERELALAKIDKALEMWPQNPEIIEIREEILNNAPPPQPIFAEDEE